MLLILMVASEKSHQNLSDSIQLSFKKRFEVNKKLIFSIEKIINSHDFEVPRNSSNKNT